MKRIAKVKLKDGNVEIKILEDQQKAELETTFKSSERPHPDLELALSALEIHVRDILELDAGIWAGGIKITGVTFSMSEETGVEGAVITGQAKLDTSNAPFCFNTPHLAFAQYSPTGESPVMSDKAIRDVKKVREEAKKYIDGKRAQLEIPLG